MSWSTQLWVSIELDMAMHALDQPVMIISLWRRSRQFQFPINYIFIDLQTKQCCNNTGTRESLWRFRGFFVWIGFYPHLPACLFTFFNENYISFLCKHSSLKDCPWSLELTANLYKSHLDPASTSSWLCMERKTIHKCTE